MAEAFVKNQMANNLMTILTQYMCPELYLLAREDCDEIFQVIFEFLAKNKTYLDGRNFFNSFQNMFKTTEYSPIKAYIFYFSYYSKNYSEIDRILYNFAQHQFKITESAERRNYFLFQYYKGLIHLHKKEFVFAAFSFLSLIGCAKPVDFKFVDYIQLEGFKKLILIYPLLDSSFKEFMRTQLKKLEQYKNISQFDKYYKLYEKLISSPKEGCLALTAFIVEQEKEIKTSANLGLANYSLMEARFQLIKGELKKYKRIFLNKFCNKINLAAELVKNILEIYSLRGCIDVKYDEETTIIEVISCDMDSEKKMEELKKCYGLLNTASMNWALYGMAEQVQTKPNKKSKPDPMEAINPFLGHGQGPFMGGM
ncbi:MAG: hypothetical protein MJ252_08435 [archaeon]|nr:hypothetical protein [archaeon]